MYDLFSAVIFDFDGVIGDTMADNYYAWYKAFSEYGITIEEQDYYLLEGMGRFAIARFFIEKYSLDPGIEKIVAEAKEKNYIQDNQFKIFPDVYSIFNLLGRSNTDIAIVTGASRQRIQSTLDAALLVKTSVIVTSDDIRKGKPDPEPYLLAIQKLGVKSGNCLVIENAKLGIESAKAAGCTCFAIQTTMGEKYLQKADKIFKDHVALNHELKNFFDIHI